MDKKCVIVTNPMIAANKSAQVTLSKFLRVLLPCYQQMTVVGGNVTVEPDLKGVEVISLPIRRAGKRLKRVLDMGLLQLKMARYLRKNIAKYTPVYFWVADKMLLPFRAARGKKADIRYFLYGNVMKEGSPSRMRRLSGKLIGYMANRADSVCVESPGVLREWEGVVAPKRVRTIYLYTRPEPGGPIVGGKTTIGMLCRLTEGKHVLESIRAFAKFHEEYENYCLEIIGSGKLEDECRALIAQLGAGEYIRMPGWIDHRQVPERTAHWQYLLFPSDTEGMPNSVIEMMGLGIPAIASPVGGVADIICHGRNGYLLTGTGEEEILAALRYAMEQDEGYIPMAQAARNGIRETFSLENAQQNALRNIN